MKPHLILILPLVLLTESCVTSGPGRLIAKKDMTVPPGVNEALTSEDQYTRNPEQNTGNVVQLEVANGQNIRITNRGPRGQKTIKPTEVRRRFQVIGDKSFMAFKPIR